MQEHKVKFTIPKGGGVKFEVIGGQGTSCTEVTRDIELHLSQAGGQLVEAGKKPEYYDDGPSVSVFNDLN
ncbi:DUF2997 domain-containing protein [Alicyclobacillus shizuokensis]|uniref:DUF2997 domain-containing protein n=1 Tax=Alicyclobacillus shizuokensis TaxID=392014 RepID=UPI00082CE326|nr:DUF2997 domain-containing protein [Alicyclobacillus shizuokensis]